MQSNKWNQIATTVNFNIEIDINALSDHIPKESAILDFGCGYGRISNSLYEHGFENIHGIDTSDELIQRGKSQYPNLNLIHVDGEKLPFQDNTFSAVILCAVLTCIPFQKDRLNVIKEITRVLKGNGIIHLVEFCTEQTKIFDSSIGIRMNHSSVADLESLVLEYQRIESKVIDTVNMRGKEAQVYSYMGIKEK